MKQSEIPVTCKNDKIEPRFYRDKMGNDRFHSFVVGYKDSDLWIGIDPSSYRIDIPVFAQEKLVEVRKELEAYLSIHPEFKTSFIPIDPKIEAPEIAHVLSEAATKAQTGPMAAVAGAFSEYIGKTIQKQFNIKEIIIENGGDLYLSLQNDIILSVYAGTSPLSGKIGIEIPAAITPIGVCTSAGTVGPSKSFGKADAIVVASKNTASADAFATAIGNRVKLAENIDKELGICDIQLEIISLLIVCEGKVGIKGLFKLKLFK